MRQEESLVVEPGVVLADVDVAVDVAVAEVKIRSHLGRLIMICYGTSNIIP